MIKQSVSFVGKDLGIIIGVLESVIKRGIMVYKPINNFYPNRDSTPEEIYDNLPSSLDFALFPYESVKLINLNNKCIFKNRNNFDRIFQGIKPDNAEFSGRGDLEIIVDLSKISILEISQVSNFKSLVLKKDSPSFYIEIPKDFDKSLSRYD